MTPQNGRSSGITRADASAILAAAQDEDKARRATSELKKIPGCKQLGDVPDLLAAGVRIMIAGDSFGTRKPALTHLHVVFLLARFAIADQAGDMRNKFDGSEIRDRLTPVVMAVLARQDELRAPRTKDDGGGFEIRSFEAVSGEFGHWLEHVDYAAGYDIIVAAYGRARNCHGALYEHLIGRGLLELAARVGTVFLSLAELTAKNGGLYVPDNEATAAILDTTSRTLGRAIAALDDGKYLVLESKADWPKGRARRFKLSSELLDFLSPYVSLSN